MSKLGVVVLVLGVACAAAAGCKSDGDGDGSGGGSCGPSAACGGDVVGDWTVQDVCLDDPEAVFQPNATEPECDGAVRNVDISATGTYRFGADGSGSSELTLNMDIDALWTEACLRALAGGASVDLQASCTGIEANYAASAEFEGAACNVEGNACACMITAAPVMAGSAGSYRVDGDELVDLEEGDADPFCVENDTLTIWLSESGLRGTVTLVR